jgi:RND family efflux transporter MFP subunit
LYIILLTGGALCSLALLGFIQPWHQRRTFAADMRQLGVESVAVVSPQLLLPGTGLDLPAEVKPWQEASIYPRVNGYLKSWLVDTGEHVEAGQLLSEVEIPDLQRKIDQAQSQAVLTEHSLQLAKDTNTKWQQLFKQGVVSQREAENTATSLATSQANAEAVSANLRFLQQEVAFQRVTARFAGTITARNANVGDLITANNTNFEMFHLQQMNPLRVFFFIPQAKAPNIAVGQTFNIQIGAQSATTYLGNVISTSEAVSPNSRSTLVQLQVDNSKNEILPGSSATVRVPANVLGKVLTLPHNTLIFRGKDAQIAVVGAKGVVQFRDVRVGRYFGVQREILSGVIESDKVIVNPSDSLVPGVVVHVSFSEPQVATK